MSPSKPDDISLSNLSMISKPVITEGYNVTFACSGDVGRPPAKFIFQKYRNAHILFMNNSSTSTSIQELPDNCSYYRTSNITLQIAAEDNQAVMRCVVVSTLTDENMYVETKPLDVKCK